MLYKSLILILLLGFQSPLLAAQPDEVNGKIKRTESLIDGFFNYHSCSIQIENDGRLPSAIYLENRHNKNLIMIQDDSETVLTQSRKVIYLRLFGNRISSEKRCKEFKDDYSVILKY